MYTLCQKGKEMKSPRDKYQNDSYYRNLVDVMISYIQKCDFTPSELREATLLASILYEEQRMPKIMIPDNVENAMNTLSDWVNK